MTHHAVSRISVMILGVVIIAFGIFHFMKPDNLIVFVPEFLPGGKLWIYLVGGAFVLAGVSFIIHRQVQLSGYLLAVLLLIFVLTIHVPNYINAGDIDQKNMAFVNLLKDTALAAFAMYIASNARNLDLFSGYG